MISSNVKCNQAYWSTRYECKCVCRSVANYLVELHFLDPKKNGWYHCQEIEPLPQAQDPVIDITNLIKNKRDKL